jgi:2-C-methyl-D-erythritol 4-phosphate cytidylyltransferase/2-C-methyl-D-erythritol 2,4-cyclodiphosphate synthase
MGRRGADGTDEAALAERAGHPVRIVEGDDLNVKVTTAGDFALAQQRLAPASAPRVGIGYDLHRLEEGRPLVIGGVIVPSDRGARGHSDADVAAHALTDAVLGAACLGDIGRHFPDTDPRWRGASSLDLLARAVALARERGLRAVNADLVVVLERPKLAAHVEAMRANLARALEIDPGSLSVKAKTNEGVDAVGRGEAIAAHAILLLIQSGMRDEG